MPNMLKRSISITLLAALLAGFAPAADVVGLPKVLEKIQQWAKGHQGDTWQPSALLVKLASEGGKFTPA